MQGPPVMHPGILGETKSIPVGFVDDHDIGHFDNTPFDPLQFVACTGDQQQQEEIGHGLDSGLALSDPNRFDQDMIESGGLAKQDGLPGLSGDTA